MKSFCLTLLAIVFCTHAIWAQDNGAHLLAQSPDGKTVKLVWFLKSVPGNIAGYDIKRKDGLGQWQVLNRGPLLPGISLKKDLTQVESDNIEVARIKEKLKDLLKTGKLKEYPYNTFIEKWKNNDKEILDIMSLAAVDFDVSVMVGFGYVDHTATQKMEYQYGLFVRGTDKQLDKVSWNYGEIPDLNVVREITSKAAPGKKGVQLIWNADVNKMRTGYVAGFNVYKRGIRLNEHPINTANSKDPSEFTWKDIAADASVADQYSISTESLFGIEGIIRSYTYEPAEHPAEYKTAVVTTVSSLGYYFKDGISVAWTFPKEYEQFIKGFYIEKDNMPDGYLKVSEIVAADKREYIDKTGSSVSSLIRIRVTAIYNDRTLAGGVERLYSYFPMIEPPKPQGTKVTGAVENKKFVARISWQSVISGDSATHHYKLYGSEPLNGKFLLLADNIALQTTSYAYTIRPGIAAGYRFFVVAVGMSGVESVAGDTVFMQVPTFELPVIAVFKAVAEGVKTVTQWQYPDVPDLAGFRLYDNSSLIADERILNRGIRDFTTEAQLPGSTHNYTIIAVTDKGIVSEPSAPATVVLPVAKK